MNRGPSLAEVDLPEGSPSRKTRLYSVAVPIILGFIGLALVAGSVSLGIGSASEPGPGLWPFAIGSAWTLAAGVIAWENFRGETLHRVDSSQRPAIGFGLTVAFILLFSYVGVVPAVLLVTTAWMKLLSDMSWKRILISSSAITVILYVLFSLIIRTAFPDSLLPFP
uniref:tripartite tricarboxylate transporter TctB family protein n=1 Tax=Arthrobacter sp. TaxID=1667 RepID=UPI000EB7089D|nr:tripartite tricarboxylate transporter TctB family protein [Arthrobacter sp.]AXV46629.1 TctB - tripartite tricarboxylate transporter TctB family protein [Arthrobacter sp.]